MAKYTVHHICGHEQQVNLCGSWADRYERIACMERCLCPECRKQAEEARRTELAAKILAESGNLPVLAGSEKQVAWALRIRQRWVEKVRARMKSCGNSWEYCLKRWEESDEDRKERILSLPLQTSYASRFARVITETSAKFYIDHRND